MASSCSSPPDEPKRPHPTSRAWLCLFLDPRTGVDLGVLRLGTLPPPHRDDQADMYDMYSQQFTLCRSPSLMGSCFMLLTNQKPSSYSLL